MDQRPFRIKGKQGYAIQWNYYYLDWVSIVDWRRSHRMEEQRKIVMIMTPSKGETKPKPYKFKRINFIVSYFVFAADRFIFPPEVSTICNICRKNSWIYWKWNHGKLCGAEFFLLCLVISATITSTVWYDHYDFMRARWVESVFSFILFVLSCFFRFWKTQNRSSLLKGIPPTRNIGMFFKEITFISLLHSNINASNSGQS